MSKAQELIKRAQAVAVAGSGYNNAPVSAKPVRKSIWSRTPIHSKIGLGLGATSLGVSLVGLHNNMANRKAQESSSHIEEKSLQALNKIHRAVLANKKTVAGQ